MLRKGDGWVEWAGASNPRREGTPAVLWHGHMDPTACSVGFLCRPECLLLGLEAKSGAEVEGKGKHSSCWF